MDVARAVVEAQLGPERLDLLDLLDDCAEPGPGVIVGTLPTSSPVAGLKLSRVPVGAVASLNACLGAGVRWSVPSLHTNGESSFSGCFRSDLLQSPASSSERSQARPAAADVLGLSILWTVRLVAHEEDAVDLFARLAADEVDDRRCALLVADHDAVGDRVVVGDAHEERVAAELALHDARVEAPAETMLSSFHLRAIPRVKRMFISLPVP